MKNLKTKTAFSLVELSVVLLIIGIIIAGITQSSRLIAKFRLSSARTQTESSPVNSIKGLTVWFEPTLERSLDADETDNATAVSTWYDISNTGTKMNATSTTILKPLYYEDCINDLPCLRFDGTDDYMSFDGSEIVGSDYTIFAVVQRRTGTANYFLGTSSSVAANAGVGFGYTGGALLNLSQGDVSNDNTVAITTYSTPVPQLHAIVNDYATTSSSTPISHYLNGSATASALVDVGTPAHTSLSAWASAALGAHHNDTSVVYYNGDIGEIIIYDRTLNTEERVAVEDYLDKKWKIN